MKSQKLFLWGSIVVTIIIIVIASWLSGIFGGIIAFFISLAIILKLLAHFKICELPPFSKKMADWTIIIGVIGILIIWGWGKSKKMYQEYLVNQQAQLNLMRQPSPQPAQTQAGQAEIINLQFTEKSEVFNYSSDRILRITMPHAGIKWTVSSTVKLSETGKDGGWFDDTPGRYTKFKDYISVLYVWGAYGTGKITLTRS